MPTRGILHTRRCPTSHFVSNVNTIPIPVRHTFVDTTRLIGKIVSFYGISLSIVNADVLYLATFLYELHVMYKENPLNNREFGIFCILCSSSISSTIFKLLK